MTLNIKNFFNSILAKILIPITILIIIITTVILQIVLPSMEKDIEHFIHTAQMNSANHLAEDISIELNKRKKFINIISNIIPKNIINNKIALQNWLNKRPQALELFKYGVAIVGLDGKVIAQVPIIKNRSKINFKKIDWFHQVKNSDNVIITKPFMGKAKKEPMIAIAKSIKDKDNKTVAIVYGILTLDNKSFLKEIYEAKKGIGSGFLLISTKHKLFLASDIKKLILKPTPPKGKNKLHDKAMNDYRGVGITTNAFGITELVAIVSVKNTDWFLVIRKPIKEAYKPIYQMKEKILYIVYVSTILILLILFLILRKVLRPLKDNSIIVNEIANNQRNLEKLKVIYNDEVGDFINGFNLMVKRVEDDFNRQAQMAQMGEMISIIAHQWKQPIASISAVSQSLKFKNDLNKIDNQLIEDATKNIDKQVNFMIDTIDEFRHFFNPDKKAKDIDLNKTIQTVINLLEIPLRKNNVDLQTDINLKMNVYSFNNLIVQVLLNLIKNANEQFNTQKEKIIKIIAYEEEEYTYIKIQDNAGGIPQDVLPKIFDKYFSTKNEKNGTGIGLDFCKSIIEKQCQGKLFVENKDSGALFTIKLKHHNQI
jgi:signal transduction histidine kinase